MKRWYWVLVVPIVFGVVLGGYVCWRCRPGNEVVLAYNRKMEELADEAERVVVWVCRLPDEEVKHKLQEIDDREVIRTLLLNLRTDDVNRSEAMYHKCPGHVKIDIDDGGRTHRVSFDHGDMVMSSLMKGAGCRELSAENIGELKRLLYGMGYDRDDLGE